MAHGHSVYNTDERFTIDTVTRAITQQSGKSKLMQYDHNSERYEFEMDRYIDGHDMSLCNDVRVNYLNIASSRDGQTNGPYVVKDMQVSPDDENKIVFSWLISRNSTKYAGTLNFNISFRCLTGAIVDYAWYTDIFKGISVSTGIENNGNEYVEEYIDILEQWKQDVIENLGSGTGTVTSVNDIGPDENGNVKIELPDAGIKTVNGIAPDENGNVDVSGLPEVNGDHKNIVTDSEGNVKWEDQLAYATSEPISHENVSIGIYSLGYASAPFTFIPVIGETYTVIWDGTEYLCTASEMTVDSNRVFVIGNTSHFGGSDNQDLPFGIGSWNGAIRVYSAESGDHVFSLSGNESVVHKIPREYIDFNPLVGVIDTSYYNFRYLNESRGASIAEIRKAAIKGNRDILIRLDLDNWQGTLRYIGLTNVSTDDNAYTPAMLFSTVKTNNVSINASDEVVNGTMQLEYWYALLEPTEGPPSDAFVNFQFAEINLVPGASRAGYYMRVNEDGFWEATEGPDFIKTVNGVSPDADGNITINIPTDEHVNELINAAMGVIENGSY